ncbi:MAG: hypothetical protein M3Y65_19730 [Pseudomonadota bacterium]|nr:hypothetical protein [Pseudomonadota bacterium]
MAELGHSPAFSLPDALLRRKFSSAAARRSDRPESTHSGHLGTLSEIKPPTSAKQSLRQARVVNYRFQSHIFRFSFFINWQIINQLLLHVSELLQLFNYPFPTRMLQF